MADIEDFDLDKTTKQAWDEFTERLADVLSVMDASADLTISAVNGEETRETPPAVRFSAVEPGVVEATLVGVDSPRLTELGWTSSPRGFTARRDQEEATELANLTTATMTEVVGVLHPNIDVEFDAMAGVLAKWDEGRKAFVYGDTKILNTVLHLADNTTVFQIGANEGEDMGINIGDMRSHALGLNAVLVTDRESAARSITIIDNAIDKVSTQRAKLGAYQNRLEHTINNLTVAGENLTAAESRIRDTDMAKEMMNFTKLNIMLQAGNAMLAQANQLPQNVLSLIR